MVKLPKTNLRKRLKITRTSLELTMKPRLEKSQPLLRAFCLFAPTCFSKLVKNFRTAHDLQPFLNTFCEIYSLDAFRCADEPFNFARSFKKFDYTTISSSDEDNQEEKDDSDNDKFSAECFDEMVQMTNGASDRSDDNENETQTKQKVPSFTETPAVLCRNEYSLVHVYPALGQVYSIAVAFPLSTATALCSISVLKRTKTPIRSSMVQERLKSLLEKVI